MTKYILLTFLGITFLSCSNDDALTEDIFVLYNQTYCSDPWGYADNDGELADKIRNYFEDVNIEMSKMKIDSKGTPQLCNACLCLSGKRIVAKISKEDLDSVKSYGFEEYE